MIFLAQCHGNNVWSDSLVYGDYSYCDSQILEKKKKLELE